MLLGIATGGAATGYSYDAASRVLAYTHFFATGSANSTTSFAYNPAGQIAATERSNDAYAWTGHVNLERPYAANGLNQYTAAGGASFAYDANGNLTGDGTTGYLYDVENRLVARSGGGSAGLRYDPLGRLYEVAGGALGTQRFLYDGDALVAEYDGAGALLQRYVHGTDAGAALRQAQGDRPLVWYEGGGVGEAARRDLFADERGSVVAVTDAAGNVTAINTYDEYGIPDDAAPASLATGAGSATPARP